MNFISWKFEKYLIGKIKKNQKNWKVCQFLQQKNLFPLLN